MPGRRGDVEPAPWLTCAGLRLIEVEMPARLGFLDHRGEMAARIRDADWSGNPLGSPSGWPQALRLALDLCLGSSFPTAIYWGPELRLLYNDAWVSIPAERHPWALGRPAAEVWTDIWDEIAPGFARAIGGEGFAAYDQMLPMVRDGHPQETWWTYSFSPLRDESGAIVGVFNQGHETTRTVHAERELAKEAARLRASEERLQLALDSSMSIGTWDWDVVENRVTADARFARLYGVESEVAERGGPIEAFFASIHPDDLPSARAAIDESLRTGAPYATEYRLRKRDGSVIWVTAQGRPAFDDEGRPTRFPGITFDITSRRRAEEDARAAVTELSAATERQAFIYGLADQLRRLESAPAIMGLVARALGARLGADRAGFYRIVGEGAVFRFEAGWSNDRLPVVTGEMPTTIVGAPALAAFAAGRTVAIADTHAEAAIAGESARERSGAGIGVPLLRGGRWVAGLNLGALDPRQWTADEVALAEAVAEIAWDAVQRVDTLAALRDSEAKFRAIADSIDQMVWSTTPDGLHDYFNQRWYEYTGVPHGSTDGEAWNGMFHPEDQDRAWSTWRRCLETGEHYRIEYRLRHHSSQYRWVLGSAQPVHDDSGRITRWFGTCTDIQEIVEAREVLARSREELELAVEERSRQLMQAEERLRQAHKMEAVGQLTGGIAHDFNNMLAVVIGALDLLERRIAAGRTDVARYVDAARDGAMRAAALTQRLLSFARRAPLEAAPVDCNALITGMAELLTRTLGETIEVEAALDDALWTAVADASQLENAVLNLSVNARDAMPDGGRLTIATANRTIDAGEADRLSIPTGDYVEVAVRDSGAGMPPDVAARAFDPFFTTKDVGKGTGLGLSQVFGFVGQLGGAVELDTAPGRGTEVSLLLPRYFGLPPRAPEPLPPVEERHGGRHEIVLVVEDEERVRNFSVEALRELGYTVIHAADGATALAMIDSGQHAHLLFTDVVMPGMNGRALADAACARLPALKVLYTSGYTPEAVDAGDGFATLAKPFDVATLAARVRAALDAPEGTR